MRRRPVGRPDGGEFAPGPETSDDDIATQVADFEARDVRSHGAADAPAINGGNM